MTCKSNAFSFSSEAGEELIRETLWDHWPHTPRDYQIEAVVKLLDGTDVLAILPTSAGKTATLTMFMLVLDHMRLNLEYFPSWRRQFPDELIVVVYPTNCLEEEQVHMYTFRNDFTQGTKNCLLRLQCSGGRTNSCGHQCRGLRTLRDVGQGRGVWTMDPSPVTWTVDIQKLGEAGQQTNVPWVSMSTCCRQSSPP